MSIMRRVTNVLQGRFILAGVTVAALCWALGCGGSSPIGQVSERQGTVEHRLPGTISFQTIDAKQPLFAGSALRTGEDSRAVVAINGIGDIEFRADSFFEFSDDLSTVTQGKGLARFTIKNQKDCFKVKTPHGVTAVLGTTFLVRVAPTQTEVVVERGTVEVTCTGTGEKAVLSAGKRVLATEKGFPGGIEELSIQQLQELGEPGTKIHHNRQ